MVPLRKPLAASLGLVSLLAFAGVTSAQTVETTQQFSPVFRGLTTFFVDIVVGGILVAALPAYTRDSISEIRDDPGGSFLWGLLVGIGGLVALVVLAITIIGLLVAIPGFVAFFVVALVGGAVATVFLGSTVTRVLSGRSQSRPSLGIALVVGAFVAAVLSVVPLVGGLVLFVVDTLGLGVVGRTLYRSYA
ncbi:hypothetical protein [Haloferax profundi]|uniref:DUF8173 domain-containing protein n=1 Tax=Haloferax profundi TaxID=1544718 RepID=A0A0W1SWE1_9EURY|nr:hypothetical protein [Haloferax profundi]KTG30761.1 hypothetical protein AUR66_06125 [Haloferax profundi]